MSGEGLLRSLRVRKAKYSFIGRSSCSGGGLGEPAIIVKNWDCNPRCFTAGGRSSSSTEQPPSKGRSVLGARYDAIRSERSDGFL